MMPSSPTSKRRPRETRISSDVATAAAQKKRGRPPKNRQSTGTTMLATVDIPAATNSNGAPAASNGAEETANNAHTSFEDIIGLGRAARAPWPAVDESRDACEPCGRTGHLAYRCPNSDTDNALIATPEKLNNSGGSRKRSPEKKNSEKESDSEEDERRMKKLRKTKKRLVSESESDEESDFGSRSMKKAENMWKLEKKMKRNMRTEDSESDSLMRSRKKKNKKSDTELSEYKAISGDDDHEMRSRMNDSRKSDKKLSKYEMISDSDDDEMRYKEKNNKKNDKHLSKSVMIGDNDDDDDDDDEMRSRNMKSKKSDKRMSKHEMISDSDDIDNDELKRWKEKMGKEMRNKKKGKFSDYNEDDSHRKDEGGAKWIWKHRKWIDAISDDDIEEEMRKIIMRRKKKEKWKRIFMYSNSTDEDDSSSNFTKSRKTAKRRRRHSRGDGFDDEIERMISHMRNRHKLRKKPAYTSGSESYISDESSRSKRKYRVDQKLDEQKRRLHEPEEKRKSNLADEERETEKTGSSLHKNAVPSLDKSPNHEEFTQLFSKESPVDMHLEVFNAKTVAGSFNKRKTRGLTRCSKILALSENECLSVSFDDMGEPVGPNASHFSNFLGTIARKDNIAPLTYKDWRNMPSINKDCMWDIVKSKFILDESRKEWTLKSIAGKWRNYKFYLKKFYYDPLDKDEDRLANMPKRIQDKDQWCDLVKMWSSEKWKKSSANNKNNRAKMKMLHCAGSKSFARIREDERAKNPDGEIKSLAETFIKAHTRKDGKPIDEASGAVIEQLKKCISLLPENSKDVTAWEEIFSLAKGDTSGSQSYWLKSSVSPPEGQRTVDALRAYMDAEEEVHKLRAKVKALEEKYASAEDKRVAAEEKNALNDARISSMEQNMSTLLSTIETHLPGFQASLPPGF